MKNTFKTLLILTCVAAISTGGGLAAGEKAAQASQRDSGRASGGPDAFGYRWVDQADPLINYSFLDISATGATVVTGNDASSGSIALTEPLNFYGVPYNAVAMSTNGYVSTDVTDPGTDTTNDCPLPAVPDLGAGARIYPLHDDLVTGNGLMEYFATCPRVNELGTGAEGCTVFQWDNTSHFGSTATFAMEAIIYHTTGVVLVQVGTGNADQGASSTTGIQNDGGTIGIEYACNAAASVPDNTAVAFFVCPTITLSPTSPLPNGTVGVPYSATFSATGGIAPYAFTQSAGTLPPGLTLNGTTGVLSGTPTTGGPYNFDITATDAAGCTGTQTYDLTIDACTGITITPPTVPPGMEGNAYNVTFSATGGTPPYAWSSTGTLPPGLTLNATSGVLSGTPTTIGSYTFTVTATDSATCIGSTPYTLLIRPALDFIVGEALAQPNGNMVRVYKKDGTTAGITLTAYSAGAYGTNVAGGEINGGYAEILTAPGPGPIYGPQIRGWSRAGTPMGKVNFYAYGTLRFGANVASTNLDGDAFMEIISGAGPGAVFGPHTRGWNFDGVKLTSIKKISFFAYKTLKWGVNVEDGNVDNDNYGEILTGAGPGSIFAPNVRAFNYDANVVTAIQKINFNAYTVNSYGVNVAGGDVDSDGYAEIATAPGPGPGANWPSQFKGFNYDGGPLQGMAGFTVDPYPTTNYGGRVGLGDFFGDLAAELITGDGLDPAADATVNSYSWNGTSLNKLTNSFLPFTSMYGVNVSSGGLGYY